MKKNALVFALSAALLLTGCGVATTSSQSNGSSISSQTNTSNSGEPSSSASTSETSSKGSESSSSSSVADKYLIRVSEVTGVTVISDKTAAEQGETVSLTITVSGGYSLTGLVYQYSSKTVTLTVTDGKTSFTMPNADVLIKASVAVEGDVVLAGDVAAAFVKEDGIYVARNVVVNNRSSVIVNVKGNDGTITKIGHGHLNSYKSFGAIELGTGKVNEESTLYIGGNAVYDFFYDPTQFLSLTIKRVGVINAPTTAGQYEDLFNSNVHGGESTMHPDGVTGVTHWDSRDNVVYSYQKYANDVSFATAKDKTTGASKGFVYKSFHNGVLSLVDTYIENTTIQNPYGSGNIYIDDTKTMDDTALSGKYTVGDTVEEGFDDFDETARFHTKDSLLFGAESYSHDIKSLDRQQHEGYRTGFTIEDDRTGAKVDVTSLANADGGFTTTVDSFKTYTPSTSSSTYKIMDYDVHITYKIVTTFTKTGAPLSGTFVEKKYDNTAFNFSTNQYIGDPDTTGTLVKQTSFAYTYGDVKDGAPDFNASAYFATSIDASIKGSLGTNKINGGELINDISDSVNLLQIAPTPTTALDGWEYAITGSSDTDLLFKSNKRGNYVYEASDTKTGTATLNVGNVVDNAITDTINVEVALSKPKRFWLESVDYGDANLTSSDTCWVAAGTSYAATLASNPVGASFSGISFEYSVDVGLACSVDASKRTITFDASNCKVTSNTDVKVTINDVNYDPTWVDDPKYRTSFTVTIIPVTTAFSETYIIGDWLIDAATRVDANDKTTIKLSGDAYTSDASSTYATFKKGELDIDGDVYAFAYKYNSASYSIATAQVVRVSGKAYVYDAYALYLGCEVSTNKLLACFLGETDDYENYETTYTAIAGNYSEDEDGYLTPTSFIAFDKVVA